MKFVAAKHSLENILDNPVMEEKWQFSAFKKYAERIRELYQGAYGAVYAK